LEPPQAHLHPVEAEPILSALAGKNMHQRLAEEPLPSIITPCQIFRGERMFSLCGESASGYD